MVENGTFFHSRQFPSFGYLDYRELGDPSAAAAARAAAGAFGWRRSTTWRRAQINDLARDADWLEFEATVSTDADQIAIAPGYLQREWTDGGRRYFHYKMDAPIPKFFAFLSARYAVRERLLAAASTSRSSTTRATSTTSSRMVDAVKKTLHYMTDELRARTSTGRCGSSSSRATRGSRVSFPNTIPFSESIGFIARLEGRRRDRLPVLRHGARGRASVVGLPGARRRRPGLDDARRRRMAQYSALMVMEQEYGADADAALPATTSSIAT